MYRLFGGTGYTTKSIDDMTNYLKKQVVVKATTDAKIEGICIRLAEIQAQLQQMTNELETERKPYRTIDVGRRRHNSQNRITVDCCIFSCFNIPIALLRHTLSRIVFSSFSMQSPHCVIVCRMQWRIVA